MSTPVYRERPASGEATGLLVLHHGRGADEHDLLPLADALDPERRLHVVTPRGPLTVPGWPGFCTIPSARFCCCLPARRTRRTSLPSRFCAKCGN